MATSAGFRQQCPSCEAMVPVKDASFIGKKIDCPKCKYRFVVEEPPVDEDDVEEVSERGGRSERVTAQKPGNGKATALATKKRGKARRDDDDEEDTPRKKKGGPSTTLLVGVGLGVVAVIVLVVVAIFLFTGDDKKPSNSPPSGSSSSSTPNNAPVQQPAVAAVPAYSGKDPTNLLLNDSSVVLRFNAASATGSGVGMAAFESPGSFSPKAFKERFGFEIGDIEAALRAINVRQGWHFNVIRTRMDLRKDDLTQLLELKKEEPVGSLEYYSIHADLDSFSSFLFQKDVKDRKNDKPDPLALHFADARTLVIGHVPAMKSFLAFNGTPRNLTEPPASGGANRGGPGGGMMGGGMMGMMGGQAGMMGGQAGGGQAGGPGGGMRGGPGAGAGGGGPPAGMMGGGQPGGGGGPPGRGGPAAGGGGPPAGGPPAGGPPAGGPPAGGEGGVGGKLGGADGPGAGGPRAGGPPGGMMGMMGGQGGGMAGMMGGGGNTLDNTPVSSSYLTILPHMKAVMDAAEAADPGTLVSFVSDEEAERGFIQVRDAVLNLFPKITYGGAEISARAVAVHALKPDRLTLFVSVYIKDADEAKALTDQERTRQAQGVALYLKLKYGIDAQVGGQQRGAGAGGGGQPGGPAGGMMGMMGGQGGPQGGMMGMMGLQGGPQGGMMGMRGGMQGGPGGAADDPGVGGRPGAGRGGPGGRGGQQQQQADQSTVSVVQKDNALTLRIDVKLDPEKNYDLIRADLQSQISLLKGQAEMISVLRGEAGAVGMKSKHAMAKALKSLLEERKGEFPQGAHKRNLGPNRMEVPYPPDQRVSWMAELLPYLGDKEYSELYNEIDFDKSWREGSNQLVATCLVSYFLNPWSERSVWWVKYPNVGPEVAETHYVGIAGIGLDAAEYDPKKDPSVADKLGVFGYDRVTKLGDIKKPEYTIAILQVPYSEFKAPWLAGGGATVRGVDENTGVEPFVCETYKTKEGTVKRGTFAIMANGDLRFVPHDIRKDIFLMMCSITQAEKIDNLDDYCPLITPPKEQAKPKPPPPAPPANNAKPADAPKPAGATGAVDAKVLNALTQNCAMCHTGARSKGKPPVMMFRDDGSLNPDLPKDKIAQVLEEGRMPPKNAQRRPSADELTAMQNWAKGGK